MSLVFSTHDFEIRIFMGHFVAFPFYFFFQGFSLDYGLVPQTLNEYELHIWIMSLKKLIPKICPSHPFFVLTFNAHAHVSLAQMLMKKRISK